MSFSEMSSFFYWKEIIPLSKRNEAILLTREAEKPCLHPSSADCVGSFVAKTNWRSFGPDIDARGPISCPPLFPSYIMVNRK